MQGQGWFLSGAVSSVPLIYSSVHLVSGPVSGASPSSLLWLEQVFLVRKKKTTRFKSYYLIAFSFQIKAGVTYPHIYDTFAAVSSKWSQFFVIVLKGSFWTCHGM